MTNLCKKYAQIATSRRSVQVGYAAVHIPSNHIGPRHIMADKAVAVHILEQTITPYHGKLGLRHVVAFLPAPHHGKPGLRRVVTFLTTSSWQTRPAPRCGISDRATSWQARPAPHWQARPHSALTAYAF